jgi:hypothetical protein
VAERSANFELKSALDMAYFLPISAYYNMKKSMKVSKIPQDILKIMLFHIDCLTKMELS